MLSLMSLVFVMTVITYSSVIYLSSSCNHIINKWTISLRFINELDINSLSVKPVLIQIHNSTDNIVFDSVIKRMIKFTIVCETCKASYSVYPVQSKINAASRAGSSERVGSGNDSLHLLPTLDNCNQNQFLNHLLKSQTAISSQIRQYSKIEKSITKSIFNFCRRVARWCQPAHITPLASN